MENYKVYMHIFPNNKKYIGITCKEVKVRWNNGKGYKENQPLIHNAVGKYGWGNIKHKILFEGLTKDQAEQKEVELIAFYKSNQKEYGYNIESGGKARGRVSEETKKKIGDIHRGKKLTLEARKKISLAQMGDKNNNYGKHWTEERKKKLSAKTSGENHWMYGKHWSNEMKKKFSDANKIKILCVEQNKIYESITSASKINNIAGQSISACAKHKRKTAGGYHWEYIDKIKENK